MSNLYNWPWKATLNLSKPWHLKLTTSKHLCVGINTKFNIITHFIVKRANMYKWYHVNQCSCFMQFAKQYGKKYDQSLHHSTITEWIASNTIWYIIYIYIKLLTYAQDFVSEYNCGKSEIWINYQQILVLQRGTTQTIINQLLLIFEPFCTLLTATHTQCSIIWRNQNNKLLIWSFVHFYFLRQHTVQI